MQFGPEVIVSVLTFVLSSVLNNLTVVIVMAWLQSFKVKCQCHRWQVSLLQKLVKAIKLLGL